MNNKDNPCYQCPKRTITCHIDCPEYEKWTLKNKRQKQIDRERRADEREYRMRKQKMLRRWDRRR